MWTALTIAGSDSCGGAGIQADIKTMTAHGIYAMSAVTALTAQNTVGVSDIMEASPEFLAAQLDSIFTDIFPDAVKTGMVSSCGLIEVIAEKLNFYKAKNIVIDPVMVATSGSALLKEDAVESLKKNLIPLAAVITPNIPETKVLTGDKVNSPDDMEKSAQKIYNLFGCAVLVKGGHNLNDANDCLFDGKEIKIPARYLTENTMISVGGLDTSGKMFSINGWTIKSVERKNKADIETFIATLNSQEAPCLCSFHYQEESRQDRKR